MNLILERVDPEAVPQIGAELRALRDAAGIKQQDLAEVLGIELSALSRIEGGSRPAPADLPARYVAEVKRIARERAEAVGAVEPEGTEA